MKRAPSPNQDARPGPVDVLMLHYTGMQSGAEAIARLRDPAARVSSHYVVEEDGLVWQLVPEERRAWHAGISAWRGMTGLNDRSIGIEIVNPGHEWGYRPFPVLQMVAVCELCLAILGRHAIPGWNVVAHSDVAPDRKQDPGELFDWEGLAQNGVGLWPQREAPAVAEADVAAALARIGYPLPSLPLAVTAFQRRWSAMRDASGVTGVADATTRARIGAVAAMLGC